MSAASAVQSGIRYGGDVGRPAAVGGRRIKLGGGSSGEHERSLYVSDGIGLLSRSQVRIPDAALPRIDPGQLVPCECVLTFEHKRIDEKAFSLLEMFGVLCFGQGPGQIDLEQRLIRRQLHGPSMGRD